MLFMQSIQLQRKKIKKFKLEDKELIMAIDSFTISHFQRVNQKGFLKLLEELQESQKKGEAPIYEMMQLLGSCVKFPTGQPVTTEFFKDYDEFDIVSKLIPELFELFSGNLPEPKSDAEKK